MYGVFGADALTFCSVAFGSGDGGNDGDHYYLYKGPGDVVRGV